MPTRSRLWRSRGPIEVAEGPLLDLVAAVAARRGRESVVGPCTSQGVARCASRRTLLGSVLLVIDPAGHSPTRLPLLPLMSLDVLGRVVGRVHHLRLPHRTVDVRR